MKPRFVMFLALAGVAFGSQTPAADDPTAAVKALHEESDAAIAGRDVWFRRVFDDPRSWWSIA